MICPVNFMEAKNYLRVVFNDESFQSPRNQRDDEFFDELRFNASNNWIESFDVLDYCGDLSPEFSGENGFCELIAQIVQNYVERFDESVALSFVHDISFEKMVHHAFQIWLEQADDEDITNWLDEEVNEVAAVISRMDICT